MPVFQLSVDVSKLKSGAADAVHVLGKVGDEADKVKPKVDSVFTPPKDGKDVFKPIIDGGKKVVDVVDKIKPKVDGIFTPPRGGGNLFVPIIDGIKETGGAAQKTERDLISMGKAAVAAFAGFKATQYAKDAVLAAARFETIGIVMEQAGRNAGYTAREMAGFQDSLVRSGIAMTESREILARLSAANIDLYKSSQLARAAQDLAVVGGINSSEAFARMTHGIVSGQIEVLRTIGLNVTFEDSYKRLASQLGKTTDSLTSNEKMQARVNIVLQEGSKFAGIYAASMETAGKKLTSLPRYFQDISVMAGKAGLEAFGIALDGVTEKAKGAREALTEMEKSGELDAIARDIGKAFQTGVKYVDQFAVALVALQIARKATIGTTVAATAAEVSYQATLMRMAGVSRTVGTAQLAMDSLRRAGSSLIAMLGGPWGAAFTAASVGMYALYSSSKETQATMDGLRQQFLSTADGAKGLANGLNEADSTMLRIMRSAASMKLDKAREELATARKEVESFTQAMQIDEFVGGVEIFNVKDAGALEAIRIVKEYKDGIIDAKTAFDRITEAREKFGRDNKTLQQAESMMQSYAQAVKNVADKEADLGKVTERVAQQEAGIKSAKDQADALAASMEKWQKIDAQLKNAEIKGIPQTLSDAVGYALKLVEQSNYGAEAQKRISIEAQSVTRDLLQSAIASAKIAEETARAAGNMELAAEAAGRVRQLSGVLGEMEKGIASGVKKAGDAAGKAESAKRQLESVNAEIAKFLGMPERGEHILKKKLSEIAEAAQKAGLSTKEAEAKQKEYTAAFKEFEERTRSRAIEEAEINIMKLTQGTNSLAVSQREAALQATLLYEKLRAIPGISQEQAQDLARRTQAAQERSQEIRDLQTAANFMKEFAELSGNYGMSMSATNAMIEAQARIFRESLNPELAKYVDEWEKLKKKEESRDLFDGLTRGFTKWVETSSNLGKQMESVFNTTVDGMSTGLWNFLSKGENDWASFTRSVIDMIGQMATRAAISGIFSWILGGVGGVGPQGPVQGSGLLGFLTGTRHEGGMVGETSYTRIDNPLNWIGAPRFHAGGMVGSNYGLAPNERRIIALENERVLNPKETRAYNAGLMASKHPQQSSSNGGNVYVNIHPSQGTRAEVKETPTSDGTRIDVMILDIVAKDMMNGGRTDNATNMRKSLQRISR